MSIITNKIQTSVTAAQAIAMNWGPELTEPRVIVDTPAALVSLLDQLRPLAAAGKIATIDLAGNGPLEVSYKSYSANAAVLALVAPGYAMTLSGVPVARAVAVQADNKVAGYTIADTASAIAGALDMLTNLTRLTAITLTAGATLSVPYSRVLTSGGPLSRIVSPYNLTVTRVTTANLAQARTIPHASAVLVVDTAAAVLAAMSVLNADTMVGGIALSGGTGIAMTYAQYGASLSAVARLANGVALTVSGVPASAAAALQANARVTGFSISDTAANVTQVLETLNNASRLTEIAVADGGTIKLTFNRFLATGTAIARLAGTVW